VTEKAIPFAGRSAELVDLGRALAMADAGRPQCILVSGAAGMGKTTLVERALLAHPHRLLRISGDEVESSARFAALRQLAPDVAGADAAAWPLLAGGVPSDASDLAVGADLVRVLGDLHPEQLLVLLVEDAHWLDPGTAGAVQFAVRRLTVERAAVVVTTRGGTRTADLGWFRPAMLPRSGTAIELGPLSDAEVGQMAGARHGAWLAPPAVTRLAEQTGGHPLHVRVVLESLSWEQLSAHSGPLPVPRTLAGAIAASTATLSAPAQRLVAAAAVLDRPAEVRLLRTITDAEAAAAIDEAVGAGLLRETATSLGRTVSVSHPLLVTAIRDRLPRHQRRALEAAVLPHLAGDAVLRHRIAATDGYDDDLAAEVEAAAVALETAERTGAAIELLLAAADLTSTPDRRARRFLRAVGLMSTDGDIVRAFECRATVLECPPSPERTAVVAALTLLAGQLDAGGELLARARNASPAEPRLVASLDLLEATRKVLTGTGAQVEVRQVLKNPDALPQWRQLARVLGAMSEMIDGRPSSALTFVEVPPVIGRSVDPLEVPLLAMRGGLHLWAGNDAAAVADLQVVERHIQAGRRVPALLPLSLSLIAEVQLATGRWVESLATVELLLAVEEGQSRAVERPMVHAVAARVLAEHGQTERALDHLDTARAWSSTLNSAPNRASVALAAAVVALLGGDVPGAAAALDEVDRPDVRFRASERRLVRAQVLLAGGRHAEAESTARGLVGSPGWLGAEAHLVVAEATLARSDVVAAETALRAAATAIPADNGYLRAREAEVRADQTLRAGRPEAAAASLSVAQQMFAALGAWPRANRCDDRLAHLHGDAPPGKPPANLSERELEVARLVALGLSNGEAATRLFVSRKAIEFHLTNVYAKLGISSRRHLADALRPGPGDLVGGGPPPGLRSDRAGAAVRVDRGWATVTPNHH
jgi:DNA-binding CsgD family transcriptional regulator